MSEMTLSEAQAEVAKWGNFMRAFAKAQEVLAHAAQQEQLIRERETRAADLAKQAEDHEERVEQARIQASATAAEGAKRLAQAKEQATRIIQEATEQAGKLAAAARDEADGLLPQIQASQAQLAQLKDELAIVHNELARRTTEFQQFQAKARALGG